MQRRTVEVSEATVALADDERTEVAANLVSGTDCESDFDAEDAWGDEIERRLARAEAGQNKTVPATESLARLYRIARGE